MSIFGKVGDLFVDWRCLKIKLFPVYFEERRHKDFILQTKSLSEFGLSGKIFIFLQKYGQACYFSLENNNEFFSGYIDVGFRANRVQIQRVQIIGNKKGFLIDVDINKKKKRIFLGPIKLFNHWWDLSNSKKVVSEGIAHFDKGEIIFLRNSVENGRILVVKMEGIVFATRIFYPSLPSATWWIKRAEIASTFHGVRIYFKSEYKERKKVIFLFPF